MFNRSLAGLALALVLFVLSACGRDNAPVLNVYDVGADPAAYSGTITVAGITRGFAPQDPTLFGIMDLKELQCQSPNCDKWLLPVRYQGNLPAMGDEVRVTGSFVQVPGGYLFRAERVEVLRNHKVGG